MTWFWVSLLILEAIAFIAKEHADRKKDIVALMLIPGNRFDVLRYKAGVKSWWEKIKVKLKTIGLIAVVATLTWIVIMMSQ